MNTIINYNRSAKQYELSTPYGEMLETYPPGAEGAQAAKERALQLDDADAYAIARYLARDLFRHRPDLQARIWKAGRILADGHVYEAPIMTAAAYAVRSQKDPQRFHLVTHQNAIYDCACPDCSSGSAPESDGQPLCKHILAIKAQKLARRPFAHFPHTSSPRAAAAWLLETGAAKYVVGVFFANHIHLYPEPANRPAVSGEIIESGPAYLVVMLDGQGRSRGSRDVTAATLAALAQLRPAEEPADMREWREAKREKWLENAAMRDADRQRTMAELTQDEVNTLLFG